MTVFDDLTAWLATNPVADLALIMLGIILFLAGFYLLMDSKIEGYIMEPSS